MNLREGIKKKERKKVGSGGKATRRGRCHERKSKESLI